MKRKLNINEIKSQNIYSDELREFCKSNKQVMRKIDVCESNKEEEIEKIKMDIQENYIEIPSRLWQVGHKNPGLDDNTSSNLVYQPPIQGRYKDNYIFIDTMTRYPLPKKMNYLLENGEIKLTKTQIEEYIEVLSKRLKK